MSFNLKETVCGCFVRLHVTSVSSYVARPSIEVWVLTHIVVGQISTRLGMLKSDHVSRVEVFVSILEAFLSKVDDLPFVEVLRAVNF